MKFLVCEPNIFGFLFFKLLRVGMCTCHTVHVKAGGQLWEAFSFSTMLVLEIEFRSSELSFSRKNVAI